MNNFKVLLVDDEKDFLETIVSRLKNRNILATGVSSGEKALELLNKEFFDAIIMDIKMPGGIDGIDALREIKKIQPLSEVILLTGHASMTTTIEGTKLGAFDYMLKPIKLEELMIKLDEIAKKKNSHNQKINNS
jgi:DNA-binding NtrC family response regulator